VIHTAVAASLPEVLTSISHYLWPALATVVLLKLMPVIREVLRTRSYKITVGSVSVDVQTASEGLQKQITDLQNQVAQIREPSAVLNRSTEVASDTPVSRASSPPPLGARILWVDDNPDNNVYELQTLESKGMSVTTATNTVEALKALHTEKYFAVITDMGRLEGGSYNPKAGLELVKTIRNADKEIPLYVFTTQRSVKQHRQELMQVGANAITSSSVKLLEMLHVIGDANNT
jgi:CheY-like chemotaxis protein